jgi:FAD/FMN-containing dehydrogenase/Fe-S oxidoreductase
MSLIQITPVDVSALRRELESVIEGEVRFDAVTRALYSTDASVYQIEPLGAVIVKSREDLIRTVQLCAKHRCSMTMRGGGTSQAGQAIGAGLQVDTSKYFNRILELNAQERWVRVEPGIVLDELNAALRPHGLRFAPDISTASRATIGGMIANNSSGARSVLYGKTIDHVLELDIVLSDGFTAHLAPGCNAPFIETVTRLAAEHAAEIGQRYPKVLRRVGGYNLDEFLPSREPFNPAKIIVGSEGTLAVILGAKLNLVELPKEKSVLVVQFRELLEALEATPLILRHKPSAVEVMDSFILGHTRLSPNLQRLRETFVEGEPGALLCIEFYADSKDQLPPRMTALEEDLRSHNFGYRFFHATEPAQQARIWSLRESALGLSMTMKGDAKSISFVEDTAVAPQRLRDFISRFRQLLQRHDTNAGVYAHASVGCLHVRPVVNMKTTEGIAKFEAIANDVSDLVLEFGGALSGEHGDGLVRSPFMQKMFGTELYEAFRTVKRTFDPHGIFNPGKIVDSPPLTANLRFGGGYVSPNPKTYFDFEEYGGMGGAVEMCSGLGACRKKSDGVMCPSYMATREERDVTRGRANILRLAMTGRLSEAGLDDRGVYESLDLCLECRACKAECPVGVDMARFKSEFLAGYWKTYGTPLDVKAMGHIHSLAKFGSRAPALFNLVRTIPGIDHRRTLPKLSGQTLEKQLRGKSAANPAVLLFNDTFTNYFDPEVGIAAWEVIESAGIDIALAPNHCCGRPMISKGLLGEATTQAKRNTTALYDAAAAGKKLVFCEPSCLSAMREDAPDLLRGEEQRKAKIIAQASVSFEEFAANLPLKLRPGNQTILLHGHCHQKSMGLVPPSIALLKKIPGAEILDLDAGCCGMAGSFGYTKDHYEVSRAIGERKLFPQIRAKASSATVVAAGTSCRHQIKDFTAENAIHPAILLRSLLSA